MNCSILFTELPIERRAAAAVAAGFGAVEFWWPWSAPVPAPAEVSAFVGSVASAGADLVALNLFGGDLPAGERGVLSHPGRVREFRDNLDVVLEIARRTGCTSFNALYGNRIPGVSAAEQDAVALDNLQHAARSVADVGGTTLIEPLSGIRGYPLLAADDAVGVVEQARSAGHDNVALLFDTFHLAANGEDPLDVLGRHYDVVGHVQIADHPGRHEPGTGDLDLAAVLAALGARGWSGSVALEYAPSTTTADASDWLPRSRRGGP